MVRLSGHFSYAKQWLVENDIRIIDMEISGQPEPIDYTIPEGKPYFEVNPAIKLTRKVIEITDYNQLLERGFYITAKSPVFNTRRRVIYTPVRKLGGQHRDFGAIPRGHTLWYDEMSESARLIGPNADEKDKLIGPWIKLNPFSQKKETKDFREEGKQIYQSRRPAGEEEPPKIIEIDEVPILYTAFDIVCLDMADDKDEPVIALVGERGMGKSTGLNSIASRARWYGGKRVIFMNDKLAETGVLCLPWKPGNEFDVKLRLLNEKTRPLPTIHLHLSGSDYFKIINEGETGYLFSVKFSELAHHYASLLKGNSEWKFKGALQWFRNMIFLKNGQPNMEFLTLRSAYEIEEYMEDEGKLGYIKNPSTREKVLTVWRDIMRSNILDISSNVRAEWMVEVVSDSGLKKLKYKPWIAALYANIVPVNVTASYESKHFFPQIYSMIAQEIVRVQKNDPYFTKQQIQILEVVDELTGIASKNNKTAAYDAIIQTVTEGRPNRIGMVYATQNYNVLPDRIRGNTLYVFAFNSSDVDASALTSDFNLDKITRTEIKSLRQHEVIAMTKKEFVIYDRITGEKRRSSRPIKGIFLPPLNQQKVPRTVLA